MAIQARPVSNNEAYDRWQEEVLAAATDYRKGAWALADKLLEGMDRFGEAMFYQIVNDTGLSQHTIENYLSLAKGFPISRRRENVALGIHDAVRKLPEAEADAVLALAEQYHWTRENVRDRVKAWKTGDLSALKAGWKPKLTPKLSAQTPDIEDAEVIEETDKPVFDSTGAGQATAAERAEKREALADQNLSDANQILMRGLDTVERALNAENRRMLPMARINTARLRSAAAVLLRIADEADAIQSGRLTRRNPDLEATRSQPAATGEPPLSAGTEGEQTGTNSIPARSSPPEPGDTTEPSSPVVSPTNSDDFDPVRDMPAHLRDRPWESTGT